jgi:streptomycin 6-kinase
VQIPKALGEEWPHEREWLERLPRLAAECAAEWDLDLEEPFDTPRSLVVPAGGAVLKLNAPSHFEADHEADALACWAGQGAVRLLARDDERRALLLERCVPGRLLAEESADEVSIMAGLLERLPGVAPTAHPFRLVADEADRWMEEVPRRWEEGGRPFARSLLEAAIDVLGSVDRGATRLVNQDLHAGNVLRAEREPWLVIDPKRLVGEREFAVAPIVRDFELGHSKEQALARLDRLTSELGLDKERARWWTIGQSLAWFSMDGDVMHRNVEVARWLAEAA